MDAELMDLVLETIKGVRDRADLATAQLQVQVLELEKRVAELEADRKTATAVLTGPARHLETLQ